MIESTKGKPPCKSVYDEGVICELRKGHKGYHKFTKYWDDY